MDNPCGTPEREDAGRGEQPERDYEKIFLEQLGTLRRAIRSLCCRHRLTADDAAEFTAWAMLRIIRGNYAVLRSYRGGSRMSTYLHAVVSNLFRDFRNSALGKWRPSARARRIGQEAIRLETLTHRDGFELEEAVEMLTRNPGTELSRVDLLDLAASLPQRPVRRFESADALDLPANGRSPLGRIEDRDRRRTLGRMRAVLTRALSKLPHEDRQILELHFAAGLTVAAIARRLAIPQRALYTRRDRCLRQLRRALPAKGFRRRC